MKVIGIVSQSSWGGADGTFLAELSGEEIAMLAGWSRYDSRAKKIGVGTEVPVSSMYEFLHKIADSQREFRKASSTIEAVAGLLKLPDLVEDVTEKVRSEKQ